MRYTRKINKKINLIIIIAAAGVSLVLAGCGATDIGNEDAAGSAAESLSASAVTVQAADAGSEDSVSGTAVSSMTGSGQESSVEESSPDGATAGSEDQAAAENAEPASGNSASGTVNDASERQQVQRALDQYRNILQGTDQLAAFDDSDTPTGFYLYSLVTMEEGEGPSLLLAQEEESSGLYAVRVYYCDPVSGERYAASEVIDAGSASGKAVSEPDINADGDSSASEDEDNKDSSSEDTDKEADSSSGNEDNDTGTDTDNGTEEGVLRFGVAVIGGYRGVLDLEPDGNGLRLQRWSALNPQAEVVRYTRNGNRLTAEQENTFTISEDQTILDDGETIQWYIPSDIRALDDWPEVPEASGGNGFPNEKELGR